MDSSGSFFLQAAAELTYYSLPNLQSSSSTPPANPPSHYYIVLLNSLCSKPHFTLDTSFSISLFLVGGNNMAEKKLMHALRYDRYGGGPAGLKHVEVPVPVAKKGEVLVKVEAISLNPVDWKIQKGMLRPILPFRFPHIPGSDVAGEVVETGGGLAEYAVFKEYITVKRPPEVSAAEAAGLPVAALTAHQALTQAAGIKLDGTGPPKRILITAGSGGVGHYAIQLAKLATNVHITATCGARNVQLIKSLGADEVLDYRTPAGVSLESPSCRAYDAVIHCASGIPWSRFEPNLTEKGKVIDITPTFTAIVSSALKQLTCSKKKLVPLLLIPKAKNLELLLELVKEGKIKTLIDSRHPLSKGEDAWAEIMDGHATGKIIVEP
ncbi:Quinone-oxidoreductase homolog, chloroplastic [Linum perenne]